MLVLKRDGRPELVGNDNNPNMREALQRACVWWYDADSGKDEDGHVWELVTLPDEQEYAA